MAGEQRILGSYSEAHANGDLDALIKGGRSNEQIHGDRKIAFRVLQRNAGAHDALTAALKRRLSEKLEGGGLMQAEEALCIFRSHRGEHIKVEEILANRQLWLQPL
jgi:hypothetical protein